MSYIALYRKYRPRTFDDVKGQSAIVQTLRNQIKANRVGHAYLFSGPRGTGKTSLSKIFAQAINCTAPVNGSPCCTCKCCQDIQNQINVDIIEIDAASNNGIDNIRELIEESKYMPQYGSHKVYIIDEVHMLSTSAFNALLKTLEEPTPGVVFILATTDEHKVPATIYSRCQHFKFKLLDNTTIANALKEVCIKEGFTFDQSGLEYIAKMAKGGMRDSLSLLDQCSSFYSDITLTNVMDVFGAIDDETVASIANGIQNGQITEVFEKIGVLQDEGKDLSSICSSLYDYFKDMCFDIINRNGDITIVNRYMSLLAELSEKVKRPNGRTLFEIEIIRMCKPQMQQDYSAMYHRIQQLEDTVVKLLNGQAIPEFSPPKPIDKDEYIVLQYRQPDRKRLVISNT